MPLVEGPIDGDLLVLDKDGVLLDFHLLWAGVTRARAAALCELAGLAGREELLADGLGLAADGVVRPTGLLAVGSRVDSTLAAATALHQAGLPWARARMLAFEAFRCADRDFDFAAHCRALPGVPATLRSLHRAGWRLAIATTDETLGARQFLALEGLTDLFSAVVGVDRVDHSKPAPDLFLAACQESGVAPHRAIMVGDVDLDLIMGRAGGAAATIGVLSGVGDRAHLAPHADRILTSVCALADPHACT